MSWKYPQGSTNTNGPFSNINTGLTLLTLFQVAISCGSDSGSVRLTYRPCCTRRLCYMMLPVSDLEMLGFELPVSRVAELRSVRPSESELPSLPLAPLVTYSKRTTLSPPSQLSSVILIRVLLDCGREEMKKRSLRAPSYSTSTSKLRIFYACIHDAGRPEGIMPMLLHGRSLNC